MIHSQYKLFLILFEIRFLKSLLRLSTQASFVNNLGLKEVSCKGEALEN
jgi:hypothetical protein